MVMSYQLCCYLFPDSVVAILVASAFKFVIPAELFKHHLALDIFEFISAQLTVLNSR